MKDKVHVALTTDLWTSPQNESIITVTGHFLNNKCEIEDCVLETKSFGTARHTGENISIHFNSFTDKFVLPKRSLPVIHDDAKNMINDVEFAYFKSIKCAAHTLQLAINDSLEDARVKKLFEK